ncbi:MAG: peptide ABC transporter substrate-binding protein, partial [Acetobacteraceae bacterium]|nr:peptide ABC transporter substrate-binding protein [Acetobacteraceae bacterium]
REGEATWVFKLREASWQNGKPVESGHIKWNLDQIGAEKSTAYMKPQCQQIERIETPDARTIKLVMKVPNATVPLWMATYYMPMVYPESVSTSTPQGIGAGPFVLKAAERGVGLDFETNPKYYKPSQPKLKGIRFTAYADENLRVAALQAGDIDLIEYVPWQSMAAIEADPRLVLQTTDGPYMYLQFNGKAGPLADKRVRQAIAHAIKRDEVVKAAFFGRGAPLEGLPITKDSPFFDNVLATGQAYDPAKAKSLLAEAGFANGFSTSLLATAQYGMHKDTAEVVQQNLAAIGIQVELRLPDWATRVTQGNRGQYEIAVNGTASESNDPDGMANQIDSSLPTNNARSTNLPVPRIHELLAQGRAEFDQAKRRAIYDEVQRQVLEEANFVGVAWRAQGYAFGKGVKGFQNLPGALTFFSGATLDQVELT